MTDRGEPHNAGPDADRALGRREFVSLCGLASCIGVSACSLLGGGDPAQEKIEAFATLRTALKKHSTDSVQEARLLTIADQLEDGLASLVAGVRESLNRLGEVNSDYDATRSELVAAIQRHTELRNELRNRVFVAQQRLKGELNESQWDEVVGILTYGMDATRRVFQTG